MNSASKRLEKAMRQRGIITKRELARRSRVNYGSLRNVLAGNSSSRILRQKVSDFLGVRIWTGIVPKPIATNGFAVPAGTVFRFSTAAEARRSFDRADARFTQLKGREIVFVRAARLFRKVSAGGCGHFAKKAESGIEIIFP